MNCNEYERTYNIDSDELFGVVKASLQQLGQVVVLGGADQARDVEAGQRARPGVQVTEQNPERFSVKLDNRKLKFKLKFESTGAHRGGPGVRVGGGAPHFHFIVLLYFY
jgi:hypothetical protein